MAEGTAALVAVGSWLHESGYVFVTPTPETHRRVLARAGGRASRDAMTVVRDALGWNRPVRLDELPRPLRALGETADLWRNTAESDRVQSRLRFSTVEAGGRRFLFVHSAYPTSDHDAVFFGPDTYRFVAAIRRTMTKARRLVDVGCGTGAGGLVLADRADEVVLSDLSPRALALAEVNLAFARKLRVIPETTKVSLHLSDILAGVPGDVDVVIANPPYLVDAQGRGHGESAGERIGRLYRDGGGKLGTALAARIVREGLARVSQAGGGQVLLYTGVPIIAGLNVLEEPLRPLLREAAAHVTWEELDPDVFGEELEGAAYAETERLAVVLLNAVVT